MVEIIYSPKYLSARKKFLKNNLKLLSKTIKAIRNFASNPNHPGLNLEKLQGSAVWTIRIDKGNRIFFIWIDRATVLFIDIGEHDKYRKY